MKLALIFSAAVLAAFVATWLSGDVLLGIGAGLAAGLSVEGLSWLLRRAPVVNRTELDTAYSAYPLARNKRRGAG